MTTTKAQKEAKEARINLIEYLENSHSDDGAKGKIFELLCTHDKSLKKGIAKENEKDSYIPWYNGQKVVYRPIEVKTNGGRVNHVLKAGLDTLIVYMLDMTNSNTLYKRRVVEPLLFTVEEFSYILNHMSLIREIEKNGKIDGYGIQASIKPFYEYLLKVARECPSRIFKVNHVHNLEDLQVLPEPPFRVAKKIKSSKRKTK